MNVLTIISSIGDDIQLLVFNPLLELIFYIYPNSIAFHENSLFITFIRKYLPARHDKNSPPPPSPLQVLNKIQIPLLGPKTIHHPPQIFLTLSIKLLLP